MSVHAIGNLVESANRLTQEVGGKLAEINEALGGAEARFEKFVDEDFPKYVTSSLQRNIFIDPTNGDDSKDGSNGAGAIKTLARLTELAHPDGFYYKTLNLYFRRGNVYELGSNVATAEESIIIGFWGSFANQDTTEIIQDKSAALYRYGVADSVLRCKYLTVRGLSEDRYTAFIRTATITQDDDANNSFDSGRTADTDGSTQGHVRAFLKSQDGNGGDFDFLEVSSCSIEINSVPFLSYRTSASDNTNKRIPTIKLNTGARLVKNMGLSALQRLKHYQYFVSSNATYLDFAVDFRANNASISGFGGAGELFSIQPENRHLILTTSEI